MSTQDVVSFAETFSYAQVPLLATLPKALTEQRAATELSNFEDDEIKIMRLFTTNPQSKTYDRSISYETIRTDYEQSKSKPQMMLAISCLSEMQKQIKLQKGTSKGWEIKMNGNDLKIIAPTRVNLTGNLPADMILYSRLNQFSSLVINEYVDSFQQHYKKLLMTPLARTAISDDNINALYEASGSKMLKLINDRNSISNIADNSLSIVKIFNASSAKKAHQIAGRGFYLAEASVAQIARAAQSSKAGPDTKIIAKKQIAKIINSVDGFDPQLSFTICSYLNFPGLNDSIDLDDFVENAMRIRKQKAKLSLPTSIKTENVELIRAETSSNASTDEIND